MSFLNTFDKLSYKKIFSIAIFMAILFSVPVGVYLVQQQTKISSRAAYVKPNVNDKSLATPGPIPAEAPEIGRVFPWVGKEGDIVWLQGKNFGINPENKKLTVGGIEIAEAQIDSWEDDLIQFYLPEGVKQGSVAQVMVGNHPKSQSLPIIIYDKNTQVKLRKNGNQITAENAGGIVKALIWTGDDEIATQRHSETVDNRSGDNTFIFDTEGLPILTIVLLDGEGKIVPYYVDPIEFDF